MYILALAREYWIYNSESVDSCDFKNIQRSARHNGQWIRTMTEQKKNRSFHNIRERKFNSFFVCVCVCIVHNVSLSLRKIHHKWIVLLFFFFFQLEQTRINKIRLCPLSQLIQFYYTYICLFHLPKRLCDVGCFLFFF